jgi:hypothetical protein
MDNAHRLDFHGLFAEPTQPPTYYLPAPVPNLTPDLATPATTYYHAGHYDPDHDHHGTMVKPHPPRSINLFAFLEGAKFESTNKVSIKLPVCKYLQTCKSSCIGGASKIISQNNFV